MNPVPILYDFPSEFESDRLYLRAPRPGEGEAVNGALRESWAALSQWLPWAVKMPDPAESEAWARQAAANFLMRADLVLLLWRKSDGLLVGGSGMHRINWELPAVEIGYWVRTSLSGQGYITEAVSAITRFACAAVGAQRVEIRCDAANERSAAVARRAGFTLEGTLHNHARHHLTGELRDTLLFARLPPLTQKSAKCPPTDR